MAFARPLQVSDENARDKVAAVAVGKPGQQPLNQRRYFDMPKPSSDLARSSVVEVKAAIENGYVPAV